MPDLDIELPVSVPAELRELVLHAPMPGLGALPRCADSAKRIGELLKKHTFLKSTVTEAALWLLAGELDRSHEVSQSIESAEGSYWHGIMHRREGDFWNAKYWFRRVGKHTVVEQLARAMQPLSRTEGQAGSGSPLPWKALSDPAKIAAELVDCCEQALASKSAQVAELQRICWLEWQFLFCHGWD